MAKGDFALLRLSTSFPISAYQASGVSYVARELENLLPRTWPSAVEYGWTSRSFSPTVQFIQSCMREGCWSHKFWSKVFT